MNTQRKSAKPLLSRAAVQRIAAEHGKRLSAEAYDLMLRGIESRIRKAFEIHDGGRKTLSPAAVQYAGLAPLR